MSANVGDLTVKLGLEVDGSKGVEQLRSQIRALEREPDPKIGLDTRQADTNIQRLTQRIEAMSRASNEIRIGADTTGAERSVGRLDEILSRTTRAQYTAQVTADIDQALGELQAMQAQLSRLDDRPAHVEVRADTDAAIRDLQELRRQMGMVETDTVNVSTKMAGMSGTLAGLGKQALALGAGFGIAQSAMSLLGRAADFLKDAVWGTNITLDQTTVRINAFTRSASETADIMEQLRQKATDTGLPFLDLAETVATIGPIAKQTGEPLMELLDTAILLSAINPNEGLSGAIFSIREALSGDWMSLMDRFNMPRSIINQMREEGVPALTIINELLRQQGVDMEMVGQMAGIADSRTRTLFGNLRLAAAQLGRPIFEGISSWIDDLASYTSSEQFGSMIEGWSKKSRTLVSDLGDVATAAKHIAELSPVILIIEAVGGGPAWEFVKRFVATAAAPTVAGYKILVEGSQGINNLFEGEPEPEIKLRLIPMIGDVAVGVSGAGIDPERIPLIGQLIDMIESIADPLTGDVASSFASAQQYLDSYFSGLADGAGSALLAADALHKLNVAANDLAGVQGRLNDVMGAFSQQGSEYVSTQSALEKGYEIIQRKQEQGLELTQQEQQYLADYPELYGRLAGAQDDAAVQEGMVAAAKTRVMQAQDELNAAIARGERDLGPYNDRLRDAQGYLNEVDPQSGAQVAIENLTTAINENLVSAINDLMELIRELDGMTAEPEVDLDTDPFYNKIEPADNELTEFDQAQAVPTGDLDTQNFDQRLQAARDALDDFRNQHATATIEAHFISTGDPLAMQVYGYQTGGGYIGITASGNAAGGVIDQPMLSMLGEEAPAHPEYVIPTNPTRRGRALGLWMAAGQTLGVPGFADGGGPAGGGGSGGGTVSAPGAIDWSFIFAGLDTEAEDYTERAAQAFVRFFGDIEALANGDALKSAQEKLNELFTLRQIAIDTGAGEAVVAGLDAQIAEQRAQVAAIGAAMGSDVVAGMTAEITQGQRTEALRKALLDMTSASDPYQKAQGLGQDLEDLREAIALAESLGELDVAASLREELQTAQEELQTAQNALTTMLRQGMFSDEDLQAMAERGGEGFRQVYDTVFGDGALAKLEAGWARLSDAQFSQLEAFVGRGGQLTDQLVASIVDGMTSGALTIEQAMQLLGDQQGRLAKDQQIQLAEQLAETEDYLMAALASGDQARIEAAQANYDALMELIAAYAAATGRSVEDIVGSWRAAASAAAAVKIPSVGVPSTSGSRGFNATDVRAGTVRIGQTLNLMLPDAGTIAAWYAYDQYRAEALSPVGIG